MGVKISDLTAASSVADANEFEINESGTSKKVTAAQIKSYVDQTASEIKTAYESNSDTNAFTDADHSKLDGIATSANNYSHPNHSGEVTSTGDGATVIADDVVDEANLKVSNAPTDGYVLTARSGNTGGLTWEAASGGGGSALTIKEEGTALSTAATSLDFVGAAVTASGTGADKTITIDSLPSSGGTFTGDVTFEGAQYTNRNVVWDKTDSALEFADNAQIVMGQQSDLRIYHNAQDSYISANISGNLYIRNATDDFDVVIQCDSGAGGLSDYFRADGSTGVVKLYHYGSEKLKTQSGGVDITGDITVSGTVDGRDIATNIPASLGTAGQVLTVNSGASAAEWADASGGGGGDPDLYRDNAVNATTPTAAGDNGIAIGSNAVNTTTHGSKNGLAIGTNAVADYWATALGAGTDATGNSSLAVGYNSQATGSKSTAIMNSYASGESSFAAVINNNTSSYGTGGYSNIAMGANAKATSNGSTVAIGAGTVASGNFAAAVGANCEATNGGSAFGRASDATGGFSLALGASNLASQFYSVAIGNNAKSEIKGKLAYASGRFTTNGDVQAGTFILRMASTSATAVTLTSDGSATADTINQIVLPNNSAYSFSGTIIARESATDGSDYASWEIKGALLRDANAASTVLGNGIVNKLYATSGASTWAVALSADTTNGGLKVEVTGAAATNIRWVATVNTSEVTYA